MLNQHYTVVGGRRNCRLALGAHNNPMCHVADDFRCIVTVEEAHLHQLDPPFLNRFEKQVGLGTEVLGSKWSILAPACGADDAASELLPVSVSVWQVLTFQAALTPPQLRVLGALQQWLRALCTTHSSLSGGARRLPAWPASACHMLAGFHSDLLPSVVFFASQQGEGSAAPLADGSADLLERYGLE